MRITESTIRRIIREEAKQVLSEGDFDPETGKPTSAAGIAKKVQNILSAVDMSKISDADKELLNIIFSEIAMTGGEQFANRLLEKSKFSQKELADQSQKLALTTATMNATNRAAKDASDFRKSQGISFDPNTGKRV